MADPAWVKHQQHFFQQSVQKWRNSGTGPVKIVREYAPVPLPKLQSKAPKKAFLRKNCRLPKLPKKVRRVSFATAVDDVRLRLGILPVKGSNGNRAKLTTTAAPLFLAARADPDRWLSTNLSNRHRSLARVHLCPRTHCVKGRRKISVVRAMKKHRKQNEEWEKLFDVKENTWYWQSRSTGETQWLSEDDLPYPRRRRRAQRRAAEAAAKRKTEYEALHLEEKANKWEENASDIWSAVDDWEFSYEPNPPDSPKTFQEMRGTGLQAVRGLQKSFGSDSQPIQQQQQQQLYRYFDVAQNAYYWYNVVTGVSYWE
eukprot:g3490.t1